MEHEFISFKLWRQIRNTAIYISESGGCVTKNSSGGLHFRNYLIKNNKRGHSHYPQIVISFSKNHKDQNLTFYPHRAVALTYLPNHDLFKIQVDHLDGNIFNNNLWNLEWVTEAENHRRAAEARKRKEKNNES